MESARQDDWSTMMRGVIYILYGEMGSGKTYLGKKLAEQTNLPFVDGDNFLPPYLQKKVSAGVPLTREDVQCFITYHLIPAVVREYKTHGDLILAQALYSAESRRIFADILYYETNCHVEYIHVRCASWWRNIKNLLRRRRGAMWIVTWLLSKPFFDGPPAVREKPSEWALSHNDFDSLTIINDHDTSTERHINWWRKRILYYSNRS